MKDKQLAFAAIDPIVVSHIVKPTEKEVSGADYVRWGDGNRYPEYLLGLYREVPTLRSVINGSVDYVAGDEVTMLRDGVDIDTVNDSGDSPTDLIRACAFDYFTFGGYAVQIIRNAIGEVTEIYHLDMSYIRLNKEGDVIYYSEEWAKKGGGNGKMLVYPAYMRDAREQAVSVLIVKDARRQTYPAPLYAASVKACEIERSIDDYHLNEIENGFAPSALINFNNGIPADEIKEEIERNVTEKFAGKSNAGRIMMSWNDGVQNRATIQQFSVADYGAKYESLANHSRQQIYTAFRANPNLFGIPTDNLGFSSEEYEQAFKLYNRTQIQPVQRALCDMIAKIYGNRASLTIKPFSLDGYGEGKVTR